MPTLERLERFLFESSAIKFIAALIGLMLVKTGVGVIETMRFSVLLARNPFVNPIPANEDQYTMWNWLGAFIAWLIGATRPGSLIALHLLLSVAFVALFFHLAWRKFGGATARTSIIMFMLLPVSSTSFFWIGYDSLTLPLMLIALAFSGRWVVAGVAGCLLGMEHFEQGFFGAGALTFATLLGRWRGETTRIPLRQAAALWLGVILGKLALIAIFHFNGVEVAGGRLDWTLQRLPKLLTEFGLGSQYIVWSIFGVGWLAAIKFAENGRNRLPFFVALLGLCLLVTIAEDQTRVIAIISFPLVLSYWLLDPDFLGSISRREASAAFGIWVLAPWAWVWQGLPQLSAFPRDLF